MTPRIASSHSAHTRLSRWLGVALMLVSCAGPTPAPTLPTHNAPQSVAPTSLAPSAAPPTRAPTLTPPPTPTAVATPTRVAPAVPKVVIISIDGLRPDALQLAPASHLLALTQRGAYSLQAKTIFPPVTLPAFTSMLSGLPPEAHGVDWNDYRPERGVITATTIFTLAHAAGLRTVMVVGKQKFAHFNVPGTLDTYVFARGGDQEVADQAIAQVQAGFDLLFVHLPNMDYFGHLTGWMSATYLFQLTRTDEAVGRILAALPADTVVIVTADHGGRGTSHGRDIPEDMTIPWIIAGPGVRPGYVLTQPVNIMDTAATAAYVLGLKLPVEAQGKPVLEAFEGQDAAPAIRLLFTGDINPGRCPAQVALQNNDFTLPYQAVADELRAADITVGSLDGAISGVSAPSPCPQTKNLVGPPRTVEGLLFAGFDVITVATNHAKDCGQLGFGCENRSFLDTLRHLTEAGLLPVGGGEALASARAPVIVERQGIRFAFLGVTEVGEDTWAGEAQPGTNPLSEATIDMVLADVAAARANADVVIVLQQWGVEYAEAPEAHQRTWAQRMIEAGATLVVGNHPHMVQPVEQFPGGLAAYALGNFVFDQQPWRTRQGVVLEAVFHGQQLASWRLLPIHIYSFYQPRWADPEEAAQILARAPLLP